MTVRMPTMYYIILIALSLTAIVGGWYNHPAILLIGGLFMGHALTELLNDPTE